MEILKKMNLNVLSIILPLLILAADVQAETASITTDCATLSITPTEPDPGGSYFIEAEGTVTGAYYYMAYLYMDGSIIDSDFSFSGSTYSATKGPYSGEHIFRLDMKGGTSHGICSASVELIAGKVAKDPVQMAGDICTAIKELDNSTFKNNPDQRKKAFCNKLDEVATNIDYATNATDPIIQGQLYMETIEKLQKDIASKMDSSFGGLSKNDWIVDRNAQSAVYPMTRELIETLQGAL